MGPFHEGEVEATSGFEPENRGFADASSHPEGVSIVLHGGSHRPPLTTHLVCVLVCAA